MMDIIPVIDLKGGAVVHAQQGRRDLYKPIVSRLCSTSAPADVLCGLLRLHPFRTVYIADLDAIEKRGDHSSAINELTKNHRTLDFWIDDGRVEGVPRALRHANIQLVLGSESLGDVAAPAAGHIILSLDFRGADFLGPPQLLEQPILWPDRVIVMTLARVGGADGPDLARLAQIRTRAGNRRVYAAGGVRGRSDLAALRAAGAAGVLVASALHDGRLSSADMEGLD
ncbi:MAG: HisA/HisF-related TIM barrel protein [Beijerinckiaceae bacterium]